MKTLSIILLILSLSIPEGTDQSAPACTISFTINNAGIDVDGTINVTQAEINFHPDALDQSSIVATAAPATIQTGISIRDKHLKRNDYFDAARYPAIHLRSKSFRRIKKNAFIGEFNLTIKDITRPITITFTVSRNKNTLRYHGTFEINRLEFGLGESSAVLDENVKIVLEAIEPAPV